MNSHGIKLANAAIAGGLVFFGAFQDGHITKAALISAFGAAVIVFLTQYKEALNELDSKSVHLLKFI